MKAANFFTLMLAVPLLFQQGASGQVCPPDDPPFPVGTAFTYQGLLTCTAGGVTSPVAATCGFEFSLWDCADGGSMIATPTVLDVNDPTATLCTAPPCPVAVIDGHFTVQLDGGNVYPGKARFLEITVTCPPPCGDPQPGDPVTLTPRTELTPVPYALFAGKGPGPVTDDDWDIDKDPPHMFAIPTGNVGIGIGANPAQAKLHVDKDISVTGNSAVRVTFSNDELCPGSISTRGLIVESDPLVCKGGQIGVIAITSKIAGPDPQRGAAQGSLAQVSSAFSRGAMIGVSGISTPNTLSTFGGHESFGVGGRFVVSSPDPLVLAAPLDGNFWIGGSYNEVNGIFNQPPPPDKGAIAAVIGIDNNTGTAKSWGGFYEGDVCIRGNLCVRGNISATGTIDPGVCSDFCDNCQCLTPSDRRLKDHIEPIAGGLDKVTRLRGVSFQWRRDEFPKRKFRDGQQIGLIAQEVAEVLPEVVVTNPDGYKAIQYGKVVAVLVEAIKEQQGVINSTRSELGELKQRLAAVERAVGVEAKVQRANSAGLGGALTAAALVLAALVGFVRHARTRKVGGR